MIAGFGDPLGFCESPIRSLLTPHASRPRHPVPSGAPTESDRCGNLTSQKPWYFSHSKMMKKICKLWPFQNYKNIMKNHSKKDEDVQDGTKHESEWCNDERHGPGKEHWADGTKFSGHYARVLNEWTRLAEMWTWELMWCRYRHSMKWTFFTKFLLRKEIGWNITGMFWFYTKLNTKNRNNMKHQYTKRWTQWTHNLYNFFLLFSIGITGRGAWPAAWPGHHDMAWGLQAGTCFKQSGDKKTCEDVQLTVKMIIVQVMF